MEPHRQCTIAYVSAVFCYCLFHVYGTSSSSSKRTYLHLTYVGLNCEDRSFFSMEIRWLPLTCDFVELTCSGTCRCRCIWCPQTVAVHSSVIRRQCSYNQTTWRPWVAVVTSCLLLAVRYIAAHMYMYKIQATCTCTSIWVSVSGLWFLSHFVLSVKQCWVIWSIWVSHGWAPPTFFWACQSACTMMKSTLTCSLIWILVPILIIIYI